MTPPRGDRSAADTPLVIFASRRDGWSKPLEAEYDCNYVVALETNTSSLIDDVEILTPDQYWRQRARFQDFQHLYHIANTASHGHCLMAAMRQPGVIVMHDLALGALYESGEDEDYLIRAFGAAGQCLARQREEYGWQSRALPLYQQLVARSQAVIVRSVEAEIRIKAVRGAPPVIRMDQPNGDRDAYRVAIEVAQASPKRAWAVADDWEFATAGADRAESDRPPGDLWRAADMTPVSRGIRRVIGVLGRPDFAPNRSEAAFRDDEIQLIEPIIGQDEYPRDFDLVFMNGDLGRFSRPLAADLASANRRQKFGGLLVVDLWSVTGGSGDFPLGKRGFGQLLLECGYALQAYVERSFAVGADDGFEWCLGAVKISEFVAAPVRLPPWNAPVQSLS